MVKWSPPFLWPGQHIKYFDIAVKNLTDGSIELDRVNTAFSDTIVSYTKRLSQQQVQMCTELLLGITAIDSNNRSLHTINVIGRYPSSESSIFNLLSLMAVAITNVIVRGTFLLWTCCGQQKTS